MKTSRREKKMQIRARNAIRRKRALRLPIFPIKKSKELKGNKRK